MNIWILDSNSGITLFFQSFSESDIEINEHLISGLLAALNHFILTQFKSPIESIDMGGFRWIYIYDYDNHLLCVASDTKDVDADVLRARLDVIKLNFVHKYIANNPKWGEEFNGDIGVFEPFKEIVAQYYAQWKKAELMDEYAALFDFLGVFQQIFNLVKKTLDQQILEKKREIIYDKIEDKFIIFSNKHFIKNDKELSKISFSREYGFNFITLNPMNCEIPAVKKHISNLFRAVINKIKQEVGYELSLKLFAKEQILKYLFKNLSLLQLLEIDSFMLELFLIE